MPVFDQPKDERPGESARRARHEDPHVNPCRTTALLGRVSQLPNALTRD
jgi:hypothetical protein